MLVKRSEEGDEMYEAVEMMCLCVRWIVVFCWEGYCCLKGQRSMSLKGIRSEEMLIHCNVINECRSYLSVTKSSQ
jgi:hypothetical protein